MSRTMIVYFVSVLVMWVPAAVVLRRAARGSRTEQILGGLLMAVIWPLSMPVLSWTTLHRARTGSARSRRSRIVGGARYVHRLPTDFPMTREVPAWPGPDDARRAAR
jgi:hypothetical protein